MDNNLEDNKTNEILHHIKSTKRQINKFKNEIENKEIIICMGNTRSGKSTTVNCIQGNELEAFKSGKRFYIRERDEVNNTGPIISHGSLSYTKIPTVWELNDDLVIVDVPGFEDNRGVAQDIVNSLFFNQFQHARSVRFALISDINDILGDNVNAFTSAIGKMQSIIADFNELKDSICVIFTKDCKNYKREDIAEMLKKKIVNVGEMEVKKELVYHLVKNINLIGIFRMPEVEGLITSEGIACNLKGAIFNTRPIIINIKNIRFNPSERTHHTLLEIYQRYSIELNFPEETKTFVRNFENYFKIDKYVFASTEQELHDTKERLQVSLPRLTTEKAKSFTILPDLKLSLQNITGTLSNHFELRFKFLEFMDSLQLLDEDIKNIVIAKYKSALSSLEDNINKLIRKIDQEMDDRAKETVQYILSGVATDKAKIAVLGTSLIPIATKALSAVGLEIPTVTFEIFELSTAGCGLLGAAGVGVVAGGAAVHYYNTIYARHQLRKEQGRC